MVTPPTFYQNIIYKNVNRPMKTTSSKASLVALGDEPVHCKQQHQNEDTSYKLDMVLSVVLEGAPSILAKPITGMFLHS